MERTLFVFYHLWGSKLSHPQILNRSSELFDWKCTENQPIDAMVSLEALPVFFDFSEVRHGGW